MRNQRWFRFLQDEWLLCISALGLLITSLYLKRLPTYTITDLEILFILFIFFILTKGLQKHGLLANFANRLESGKFVALKLVTATFFLSMVVTNDVALVTIVPLTVMVKIKNKDWLIILEALAANAGSAFSPFGNPQNIFIYWFYQIPLSDFLSTIAFFSVPFLVFLIIGAIFVDSKATTQNDAAKIEQIQNKAFLYSGFLVLFILAIVHVLPLPIGFLIVLYAFFFDRPALKIDYALLAIFVCFFGFTDNLQHLFSHLLSQPHHVFLLSAFLSQIISNVPATLLLADFTNHWQSLLWGVSVGGFGSMIASLANLIAYRIYAREEKGGKRSFLFKFHILSYSAFLLGGFIYAVIYVLL